jgi:PAS domain S-box-containing protein
MKKHDLGITLAEGDAVKGSLLEVTHDDIPFGIYRSIPEGRFIHVNPTLVKMLGYGSRDELMQIDIERDLYFDSTERTRLNTAFPHHVKGVEVVLKRRDGSPITVQISGRWLFDREGNWIGAEGVILDWSPRYVSHEMLRIQQDLAVTLSTASNLTEIYRALMAALLRIEGIDAAGFYLADPLTELMELKAFAGVSDRFVQAASRLPFHDIIHLPVRQGKSVYARPMEFPDAVREVFLIENFQAVGAVPVLNEQRLLGALHLASRSRAHFPPTAQRTVEAIAKWIGYNIARAQAEESFLNERRLLRHLLDLQERDRQITAYELHDGIAQQLAGALLFLENCVKRRDGDPVLDQKQFNDGMDLIRRGLDEVRRQISGLRPLILDEAGVIQAVEHLVAEGRQRTGADIVLKHDVRFQRLAPPLETAVFRIVQESLANACRHSHSDFIRVQLLQTAGQLHIKVADEGVGFNPDAVPPDHFGLRGIRERARLLDGRATIRSRPGEGTEIHVTLPLLLPDTESKNVK